MRRASSFLIFVLGLALGAVLLGIYLNSTGRLRTGLPVAEKPPAGSPGNAPEGSLAHIDPNARAVLPDLASGPQPPDPDSFRDAAAHSGGPTLPTPPTLNPAPATGTNIPQGRGPAVPVNPAAQMALLEKRGLALPLNGVKRADLQDTFLQARGNGRTHEAMDIMESRGTPVFAVDEGNVKKLFTSKYGGLTVYQFDNSESYCYYYAHLDRYAPGLKEGMLLRKGDPLGFVGSTGDADANAPHLHFAIFRLGPEKRWWEGTPINPFPVLLHSFEAAGSR